ncbi:sulfatase family protein [Brachybacterium subflavum]|uniref:sulfatase family protein n=1 Tax=Brachybacterium subflavum TaxID=2585206 RepID=UPI0012661130|nr:sulfatase-like hydrolase/transferase [Brachybacterium subflavum]
MTPHRPNILFVITDQQRFDTIAALGHEHAITPNLDRLVRSGTTFTRTYVTAPSCAPSRASLFTGMYPHSTGVLKNNDPWNHSWVGLLADAGYRCINVGKMHTYPYTSSVGFHERHVVENKDRSNPALPFFLDEWDKAFHARGLVKPDRATKYRAIPDYRERLGAFEWDAPEDLHVDNFVGGLATHWLDVYPGDEPFFLQVGFPGPHPPYDPTADALAQYEGRTMPSAHDSPEDRASQPLAVKDLIRDNLEVDHDAVVHLEHPSPEQIERQRRHYMANVTMIDAQVGQLLDALERRGVLEDTVVIFTSDHGDCLNDHGHIQKWSMYEPSVRVPAIVAGPGVTADHRVDGLTSLFDLGPTILEFAGVTPPAWMEARSLLPGIRGDADFGREFAFAEHARDMILQKTELMTMVRDDRWKLVEFVDHEDGQLFDLENDPHEMLNLWDRADHRDQRESLSRVIARWRAESALHTAEWSADFR